VPAGKLCTGIGTSRGTSGGSGTSTVSVPTLFLPTSLLLLLLLGHDDDVDGDVAVIPLTFSTVAAGAVVGVSVAVRAIDWTQRKPARQRRATTTTIVTILHEAKYNFIFSFILKERRIVIFLNFYFS